MLNAYNKRKKTINQIILDENFPEDEIYNTFKYKWIVNEVLTSFIFLTKIFKNLACDERFISVKTQ